MENNNLKVEKMETKEQKIAHLEKRIEEVKQLLNSAREELAELRGSDRNSTVARCEILSRHLGNLQSELSELRASM